LAEEKQVENFEPLPRETEKETFAENRKPIQGKSSQNASNLTLIYLISIVRFPLDFQL